MPAPVAFVAERVLRNVCPIEGSVSQFRHSADSDALRPEQTERLAIGAGSAGRFSVGAQAGATVSGP